MLLNTQNASCLETIYINISLPACYGKDVDEKLQKNTCQVEPE